MNFTELSLAQNDPALFFKNHPLPVIIDEVQRAPDLFLQIKLLADNSNKKGQIILTGSQSYRLLSKSADSLAGRVCIINMAALSLREKFNFCLNVISRHAARFQAFDNFLRKQVVSLDSVFIHSHI